MMFRVIRRWELRSLIAITFLTLQLLLLINTTLINVSAEDKVDLIVEAENGDFVAWNNICLSAWGAEEIENAKYEFSFIKSGDEKSVDIESKGNCANWIPKSEGKYILKVCVIKDGKTVCQDEKTVQIDRLTEINKIEVNLNSPQPVNTNINIKAIVNGNKDGLQYEFLCKEKNGSWNTLQDFSEKETFIWKPKKVGKYIIRVRCKTTKGYIFDKDVDYVISNQYRGVHNVLGHSCSFSSAIQFLYKNEEFRNSILSIGTIDKNSKPYLYALNKQFCNIRDNVVNKVNSVGIEVAFSTEQVTRLITDKLGHVDTFGGFDDCAESRILDECYKECENGKLKTLIEDMKNSSCFIMDVEDLKIEGTKKNVLKDNARIEVCGSTTGFNFQDYGVLECDKSKFELTGVLVFNGNRMSLNGAHYYVIVKDPISKEWYELNDSLVCIRNEKYVENLIKGDKALQFFYNKV